ncbi:MAG TPA: PBP1A family penicillin-binding protein [Vicinamibacterales bacterium]|nr:PBP1A family penicillin-binding protein [Vicinamibacterales bacterium]
MFPPRRAADWAALSLIGALVVAGGWSAIWLSRYSLAVHRLTRGVGDTVFYGADGRPWFRLDEQRRDVPLGNIAENFQHAVVAIEDRRFYRHPGLDPIGIARALYRDVREGAAVEGGSTLTQQLARTLFLSNARTYGRKVKEAAIALLIEAQLTKPQILELYLNRVYLSAGVYGVEAMSQHLFRKPARSLTLAESAFIAGLLKAPSALSPWSNYDGALGRSRLVLAAMREQGFITPNQESAARAVRPRVQAYRLPVDIHAAWAKDYLRQQFRNEFGGDHPPDWQVHTTFKPDLQDAAERAVASGLRRLNRRGLEAALVAIDPSTGDLLALVGGADYTVSTFNRATRGRRQPGSTFKPLVYAAALENGYSPVSVLTDLTKVSAPEDPDWAPAASPSRQPVDALTLRAALLESNNAAAVGLQQHVGSRAVLRLAGDAGLRGLPDVPSLALGTGLVTPLDLAAAYTMFPGGGQVVRPRGLVSVLDANGEEVLNRPIERARVISSESAFQMVTMLRDVVDRGTGSSVRALGVQGPLGGKTGTTDEYRDAWFVGFSNAVVVGVWVGFDQPAPIGRDAYGARIALPIWADFMKRVARETPPREFAVPRGLEPVELCNVSYARPVDECTVYTEYFKEGDVVPSQLCSIHRGTLKQRAMRAVGGFLRSLGAKIGGIFD